jgi:hypothetical protein
MPVKHVVLLRFKPSTPPARIRQLFTALGDLGSKIPGLLDFSWGPNSSPEGLHQGFTHGFVMTFADQASRDAYLPHADHEAVKALVLPELDGGIDGAIVLDWDTSAAASK